MLLLNRTGFGIRPQELAQASELGYDGWLERQLAPEQIDVSDLENALRRNFPTLSQSNLELFDDQWAEGFISLLNLPIRMAARQQKR